MLTVSLITMIFYFHPSTTSAALYFRTVPILPVSSVVEMTRGKGDDNTPAADPAGDFFFKS